jgi:hypothetical protein
MDDVEESRLGGCDTHSGKAFGGGQFSGGAGFRAITLIVSQGK